MIATRMMNVKISIKEEAEVVFQRIKYMKKNMIKKVVNLHRKEYFYELKLIIQFIN